MTKSTIEQVKEKHESRLMRTKGVVGVGIGGSTGGEPTLIVYVERKIPETTKKIPDRLGGFPVRVEVVGNIKPL